MPAAKKFADVVVARFAKKPAAAAPADEPEDEGAETEPDEEAEEENPGSKGKLVIAAQRKGDGEAIEEAIKSIVHECLEEYGVGK